MTRKSEALDSKQLYVASILLLCVIVPLGMFFALDVQPITLEVIAGTFLIVYSGLFLSQAVASRELQIYQFIFWTFVYIWMALAPTVQIYTGVFPSTTPGVNRNFVLTSIALLTLALFTFQFGLTRKNKKPTQAKDSPFRTRTKLISESSTRGGYGDVIATIVGLFSFSTLYFYLSQVGVESLFKLRNEKFQYLSGVVEDTVSVSIVYSTTWTFSLISSIYFIIKAKTSSKTRFWIIGALFATPALIVANPISTGRYVSGCVYGSLLIVSLYKKTMLGNKILKLGLLTGVLAIFPILNIFRSRDARINRSSFYLDFLSGDYDAFAQLVNTLEYKDLIGSLFTNQFLGPLLFFIPRQTWPSKPLDTGILLANFKGYGFSNLSAPIWAEFYISFSVVGLLLLFFLVGVFLGRLDTSFELKGIAIGPMFFPGAIYSLILLRGSLLQAFGAFTLMAAVSILLQMSARKTDLAAEERMELKTSAYPLKRS